jgi:DNA repair photolyase
VENEHMFAIVRSVVELAQPSPRKPVPLRWSLADDAPPALFPDERELERHVGTGAYQGLEFLHVNARTIINTVPASSRMPFRHTINVFRGCSHACTYCFARPTHTYLGLDTGRDFDTKIVVKVNAVERLAAELRAPGWSGDPIAMGTNTDPYQRAEGKYHLTQGVVRVLAEHRNPFSILTKSTLVLRDLRLLTAAAERSPVRLDFSIGTLDRDVWRLTEPGTPPPDKRVEAVRRINEAGIACGVLVAPVLPGLSDDDDHIVEVVEACLAAGAVSVSAVPLHLRSGVREHYFRWLGETRPDLVALHRTRFGARAYQPRAEQERVSAIVRDTVRRVRGEEEGHGAPYRGVVERNAPAPAPDVVDHQLRLL